MARQKRRDRTTAPASPTDPIDPPSAPPRVGGVELIAGALILLTVAVTWLARHANNPDGVSYLDLAARLSAGDGSAFVQGYWSPLYPLLIALLSTVTGRTPTALLEVAHVINGAAVIGAVIGLWWWSRRSGGALFARAAFAALFLVSFGFPRIESVTPDLLLLGLITWLGYELLIEQGRRWMTTGALLGVTYLVKTSAWPWLLISIPLRLWGARDAEGRRDVLRSTPVTLAVMLLWILPMSVKAGHPTMGSTARLNSCWYLQGCDARSPDTHLGRHASYHEISIDSTRSIISAEFDATRWTYEPWSDPTVWAVGIQSQSSHSASAGDLFRYWGRVSWRTVSLWLLPLLVGVLLPWSLFEWRADRRRWWMNEGRPALVVAILGALGVAQFILVHAEPRLIAPYALMWALGILHGGAAQGGAGSDRAGVVGRRIAGWLGLLIVVSYGHDKAIEGIADARAMDQAIGQMAAMNAELAKEGVSQERVVIIGPAFPALRAAYLAGARVVAQIPPSSAAVLEALPAAEQGALLSKFYGGRAQVAWRTGSDGSIEFVRITGAGGATTPAAR